MAEVKEYIVKALSVGNGGNRVFHSGSTVTAEHFTEEGMAEELVKKGFLVPKDKLKSDSAVIGDNSKNTTSSGPEKSSEKEGEEESPKEYSEITSTDIKAYLEEKGVEFKSNDPKRALYDLYLSTFTKE